MRKIISGSTETQLPSISTRAVDRVGMKGSQPVHIEGVVGHETQ